MFEISCGSKISEITMVLQICYSSLVILCIFHFGFWIQGYVNAGNGSSKELFQKMINLENS